MHRRRRLGKSWWVVLVALAALAVPAATALACSCAGGDPRGALSRADAAFVGTVTAIRAVPGAGPTRRAEFRFSVERAYKGTLGAEVAVLTSADGASCGLELREGQRTGLLLREEAGTWTAGLCDVLSPVALERAARPFPPGSGEGAARLLVAGPFHDAGMAALTGRGEPIGWVFGSEGDAVGACPGGRYAVQAGDDLSVIRLRDLRVMERRPLPDDWTHAVRCLDSRAGDVVAVVFPFGARSERMTLVRVRDGRRRPLRVIRAWWAQLGRRTAYFAALGQREDRTLTAVSYRDGRTRRIGAAGEFVLSPDDRRLASVTGDRGSRLWVAEIAGGATRSRRVAAAWPRPIWLGPRRIAVLATRREARVFDPRLRRVGTLPSWHSAVSAVAGSRLWWVTQAGRIRLLDWRSGRRLGTSTLELSGARSMVALDRPARLTGAPRRAPQLAGAAGARTATRCPHTR